MTLLWDFRDFEMRVEEFGDRNRPIHQGIIEYGAWICRCFVVLVHGRGRRCCFSPKKSDVMLDPYGVDNLLLLCRSFSIYATKQAIVPITKQRWTLPQAKEAKFNDRLRRHQRKPVIVVIINKACLTASSLCLCTVPQSPALQISPSIQV